LIHMQCPKCGSIDIERDYDPKYGHFWHCYDCELDFEHEDRGPARDKEDWFNECGYYYRPN